MVEEQRHHRLGEVYLGVGEFGEDVSAVLAEIIKALLKGPYRLRSFVVFGSRARGDWKPWSDTDVVIIIDGLNKPLRWRALWELDLPEDVVNKAHDIELEARVFTPEEFEEMLRSFSLTALDALEEGVVLYDDGFWRKMRAVFERMERDGLVKRIDGGWKVVISDAPSKRARAYRC